MIYLRLCLRLCKHITEADVLSTDFCYYMDMVKRSGIIRVVLFTLVIAVIAVLALDTTGIIDIDSWFSNSAKANFVPYPEFSSSVELGKVSEATLESGRIVFTTSDGSFITDNPASPDLSLWLMEKVRGPGMPDCP